MKNIPYWNIIIMERKSKLSINDQRAKNFKKPGESNLHWDVNIWENTWKRWKNDIKFWCDDQRLIDNLEKV